jgi:hypothetical protein
MRKLLREVAGGEKDEPIRMFAHREQGNSPYLKVSLKRAENKGKGEKQRSRDEGSKGNRDYGTGRMWGRTTEGAGGVRPK